MHDLIHDEGSTCHITGVFHEGDEGIEDQDLRQENDDGTNTCYGAIHDHGFHRTIGQDVVQPV